MSHQPTVNLEGIKDCCTSGHLHEGTPKGREAKLGNLDAYITGDESNKSKTLLYLVDIFGYKLNNARLLADEYADKGFYVVMPDILEGDAVPHEILQAIAPLSTSEARGIIVGAKDAAAVGTTLPPWLVKHREAVTLPLVQAAVRSLREDKDVGKIGAVGFCFGGRYAILLTHGDAETPVDAAVANHPSSVAFPKEIDAIEKPIQINVGDSDSMMSLKDIDTTKGSFLKRVDAPHDINVFKGAVHGFAVRGDSNEEFEKKNKDVAAHKTIEFMKKYLA